MHLDPTAAALLILTAGALFALPWRETDMRASSRAMRSLASFLQPFVSAIRLHPESDLLPAPLQAVRLVVPVVARDRTQRRMAV